MSFGCEKIPPFNMDYIFSTYMLDLVPSSTLVLNDPRAIRNFNEKMYALHFAEYSPQTLVTREISEQKTGQRIILKLLLNLGMEMVVEGFWSQPTMTQIFVQCSRSSQKMKNNTFWYKNICLRNRRRRQTNHFNQWKTRWTDASNTSKGRSSWEYARWCTS